MAQDKNKETSLALPSQIAEGSDGQLYFEIPGIVKKMRGPVLDSVMSHGILEQAAILNDEVEIAPGPLPIQTRVMLSYDKLNIQTQDNYRLSPFDRDVLDAVATLHTVNDYITSEMIYRVMMGKRRYQYVTENQKKYVRDSMSRLATARIRIRITDFDERESPIARELRRREISAHYESYMIAFENVQLKKGDKIADFYHILQNPVVFNYAKSIGKVSEFPIELLDTRINKTPRTIVLQSFLLRCIDSMYRGEMPPFIGVDAMYEIIDAKDDIKQHKARHRKSATTILDDWVDKGYIKGFKARLTSKGVRGFDVELAERDGRSSY